ALVPVVPDTDDDRPAGRDLRAGPGSRGRDRGAGTGDTRHAASDLRDVSGFVCGDDLDDVRPRLELGQHAQRHPAPDDTDVEQRRRLDAVDEYLDADDLHVV